MRKVLILSLLFSTIMYSQNYWEQTNGPSGGSCEIMAVSSNGSIFVTSGNHVFRSLNNWNYWSELTSGIYFYRLQVHPAERGFNPANGGAVDPDTSSGQVFVETKKMILLN